MRAVEGNLGHPLSKYQGGGKKGKQRKEKEEGLAIPCACPKRDCRLLSPGVRARLGVPLGGRVEKLRAHWESARLPLQYKRETEKESAPTETRGPMATQTAEPSLIVKAHLTETQDSRRMIA